MQSTCPYCHQGLKKQLLRNGNCSECGRPIVVRSKQPFFGQPLLTEDEAFTSDVYERLTTSYGFNVTRATYETIRTELTEHFGQMAGWGDVAWSILQQLTHRFGAMGDFQNLSFVYAEQAQILSHEGKDPRRTLQEQQRSTLRHFKSLNATPEQ